MKNEKILLVAIQVCAKIKFLKKSWLGEAP